MEALYRLGQASAQEVMQQMPDPPNYSAVRSLLTVLEEKGLVKLRPFALPFLNGPSRPRPQLSFPGQVDVRLVPPLESSS